MNDTKLISVLEEIKKEQQISPFFNEEILKKYIKEAEYDINYTVGKTIDYDEDLTARTLLKTFVLYANHKRLAEFKELYGGDYAKLQIKYNRDTSLS